MMNIEGHILYDTLYIHVLNVTKEKSFREENVLLLNGHKQSLFIVCSSSPRNKPSI